MGVRQAGAALVTIATVAGAAAVLGLVQWALGRGGHTATARSPEYFTWSAVVVVGVVIYFHVFARTFSHVRPPSRAAFLISVGAYVVLAGLVIVMLTGKAPAGTLPTVPSVMRPLYLVAELCAAPAVLTLWLAHARLRQIRLKAPGALDSLLTIRADISRSLTALSLIASSGLINTAVLRRAHLAHGLKPELFPIALVLVYGAALTGVVALVCIPAFLAWRDRALALINAVYPLPKDARPSEAWSDGRARLTALVSPDVTVGKTVSVALGVLAPLGTALLAYYLPELKAK
jgi:hypothetical protein